jgi:hypothetical protein
VSQESATTTEERDELIDQRGVDRAQIRELLALPPLERVRRMERLLTEILELRRLNGVATTH